MHFSDYLFALVTYILNDIRDDIAQIQHEIQDGFEDLNERLAEEQAAEKKFTDLQILLLESPTSAIEFLKQDESTLHDLWDHARDGFCDSKSADILAESDSQILGEGYKQLGTLVAENCSFAD